jgi:tetratricopeptide (TPR) repeat protein
MLIAAGAVVLLLSIGWRWLIHSDAAALVIQARAAMGRQDHHEFDRLLGRLEGEGQANTARLLRGEWHMAQARDSLQAVERLHNLHNLALSAQILLDATCWGAAAPAAYRTCFFGAMSDPSLVVQVTVFQGLLPLQARAQGQLQLAYKNLSQIPHDAPEFDEAALPAAEALLRLRETAALVPLEGPYRLLRHAVRVRPDDVEAHRWLGVVCLDLNIWEEAMEEARAIARLDPQDGRPWRTLGLLLRNRFKDGAAMEAYREALRRNLKETARLEVITELASLQARRGSPTEAIETLNLCPPELRERAELATTRAEALWVANPQRDQPEAVRILERVVRDNPGFAPAMLLLGRIHLANAQPREAQALLERGLALTPDDHEARHRLAQALEMQGNSAAASEQRQRGERTLRLRRELDDSMMDAARQPLAEGPRLKAAKTCIELGNTELARQWLQSALACNPQSQEARRLLQQLGK